MDQDEVRESANKSLSSANDNRSVSFFKLFSFADRLDVLLMVVGTISAAANGVSSPVMLVIFGDLINAFGASDKSHVLHEVSKVRT
ncbi:hypothetical protein L484_015631 [Morus notabilis]|uniref:ABC transmembrane type-1 domain-containing protein n=1 Tax=Morus notabilis TaxID=981085 RepID=W9RLD5_9ROSA|nr:hypothetical protein L484_015631 [Morus notabilis]